MEKFTLLLFKSTQDAMQAEKLAKAAGVKARIVPTPEKLFASCGFSLRSSAEEEKSLLGALGALRPQGIYRACRQGLKTTYEKIESGTENG